MNPNLAKSVAKLIQSLGKAYQDLTVTNLCVYGTGIHFTLKALGVNELEIDVSEKTPYVAMLRIENKRLNTIKDGEYNYPDSAFVEIVNSFEEID